MGDLTIMTGKMTSLEIAKLTGKRHTHVLRDIDKVLKELEIDSAQFRAEYKDESGKPNTMYTLDKRLSLVLATGYSIVWRTKIIDRWEELEKKEISRPKTTIEMLEEAVFELKAKEKEIAKLGTTVQKQNETNVELFEMKATTTKTGMKTVKNDLGIEINSIIFRIFGSDFPGDQKGMHLHSRSLYRHFTGKVYAGADKTSLEGKKEYLKWLQTLVPREEDMSE